MPNAPKTPLRSIRVDTDLWRAAQAVAAARGESLSDVIRRALVRYVKRGVAALATHRSTSLSTATPPATSSPATPTN